MSIQKSKLSDHKFKKGVLRTPFNACMGEQLTHTSWTLDWLPEYIWISLILEKYGRKKGLDLVGSIMKDLSEIDKDLCTPMLTQILKLDERRRRIYFKTICNRISGATLSPLTLVFRLDKYLIFNEYFSDIHANVDDKLNTLTNVIKKNLNHQSDKATDVRFLIIWFSIFTGKLKLKKGLIIEEALTEYPQISHDNTKMRMYRPAIRSTELGLRVDDNRSELSDMFWKRVGLLTGCETYIIDYDEQVGEDMRFIYDAVSTIQYLMSHNKDKLLSDEKFSVCLGIATYGLKILKEVSEGKVGNGIIGRCALRTMVEIYVNLKYMIKNEQDNPNIWSSFKEYGLGKYKYVVLKSRELDVDLSQHHFALPVLEAVLNEEKIEEFTDMDTRHFDNKNVRSKFDSIGEMNLYDLYYEYDTNYTHGFWGAIRESAMLFCNNPAHKYHSVPDINFTQKLRTVEYDCEFVLKKLMVLLSTQFDFPEFYLCKYGDLQ